jgi:hypothetical protein
MYRDRIPVNLIKHDQNLRDVMEYKLNFAFLW